MVTVGQDGWAKAAKMEPAFMDGGLWSVSHRHKVRTRRLQADPRCTLIFDKPGPLWFTIEATVTIHDTPDTADKIIAFMRIRQDRASGPLAWHGDNGYEEELDEADFRAAMVSEGCVLYEFDVQRIYGNRGA